MKSRMIELSAETKIDAASASSIRANGARSLIADLGTNEVMQVLLSVALVVFRTGAIQCRVQ